MAKKTRTEFFVARRLGRGEGSRVGVRIAVASVAVSVAVMVVTLAVIGGFRSEITGRLGSAAGHARIHAPVYGSVEGAPVVLDTELEAAVLAVPGVREVEPYGLRGGIMKTAEATHGVVLKGVAVDSLGGRDLLVSASVARLLRLGVGDRVEMLFVGGGSGADWGAANGEGSAGAGVSAAVRRDLFRVAGLLDGGLGEVEERVAITSLGNIRRLNGWAPDQVGGYEITLDDFGRLDEAMPQLRALVSERAAGDARLVVSSVVDDNPQLFDWLATHDVNAAVVLTIMIVVALVASVSAVLILVLERIRMIGVLKTLGMTTAAVRRVFLVRAAGILASGAVLGAAVGVGLALVQQHTRAVRLDASGYFLDAVPIELRWWQVAAVAVGTVAVILALLVVPTGIAGSITPEKTIRYE